MDNTKDSQTISGIGWCRRFSVNIRGVARRHRSQHECELPMADVEAKMAFQRTSPEPRSVLGAPLILANKDRLVIQIVF